MKMNPSFTSYALALLLTFASGGSSLAQFDIDYGDAPDLPYQTLLANNGPSHAIIPGAPYFDDGTQTDQPDPEPDGQPDPIAGGDDNDGNDDEDGCTVQQCFIGSVGNVIIGVDGGMGGGFVDAWIDFNQNGSFLDAGELIYSGWLPQGQHNIAFAVPANAMPGLTFARFRINSMMAGMPPFGPIEDGEVEDHMAIIEAFPPPEGFDFGDAPDQPYPTLLANNGAVHQILPGAPYFDDGTQTDQPDSEPDGQPNPTASGDDSDGNDDEDGIAFSGSLQAGQPGSVTITVDDGAGGQGAGQAWVDAWIDYNGDGVWATPGEQIQSGLLPQGANVVGFTVPASTPLGSTFARFRIHSGLTALPPTGYANDGEVEDHMVDIVEGQPEEEFDWGDAPDTAQATPTYNTLAANSGANHLIVAGVFMGSSIDADSDGQPNAAATGDDNDGNDDEDGVAFKSKLIPGQQAKIDVTVSVQGQLDVWLDADLSGDWTGLNDNVYSGPVNAGLNTLQITIPQGTPGGPNYMRFRFNTGAALSPSGPAQDGEVEDYAVDIEELDWGDAPSGFNTLAANSGANHTIVANTMLGSQIDAEADGQPTAPANGDDLAGLPNDEDGVTFASPIVPGQSATFTVTATATGWLDVWLDVDMSSSWTTPDYIWSGAVNAGPNTVNIPIPYQAVPGQSFMRFRYNTVGALSVTGWASDGEVEDYAVQIEEPELDWGDAPDASYLTLLASGGAHHIIATGVMLGPQIDAETDGQPTGGANGDDANGINDEDGVQFIGKIVAGSNGTINVTAGTAGGKLDAWIDFGADGSWAGDHLWGGTSKTLSSGPNALQFAVPQPSALGPTYARFRISTSGSLPPDNVGITTPDGEVEDYMVDLFQPAPTNLVITNLTFLVGQTNAVVEWMSETDIAYQMQATTNLTVSNSWIDVEAPVLGPNNAQTNNMATKKNLFYRITAPWTK